MTYKPIKDFTFEDLKDLTYQGNPVLERRLFDEVDDATYSPRSESGHSHTGVVHLKKRGNGIDRRLLKKRGDAIDRRLLVKEFFFDLDPEPRYGEDHDPNRLFTRELRNTNRIYHNVGRGLVPRVEGYHPDRFLLFFKYVQHSPNRTRLIDALQERNHQQAKGLKLEAARLIGTFNGKVQGRASFFQHELYEKRYTDEKRKRRILDWLSRSVEYDLRRQGNEVPSGSGRLHDFIRRRFDLDILERVTEIVEQTGALGHIYRLQHGDCRAHHIKGGTFIDLERFGYHPHGFDLAAYCSAEGGIASLPYEQMDIMLAYFLAFEDAALRGNNIELRKLHSLKKNEVTELAERRGLDKFRVQFLALDLEEQVHMHACNVRYSDSQRAGLIEGIPNHDTERMLTARFERVKENLEHVAADVSFSKMCSPEEGQRYFGLWARLLQDLKLVDLSEEVLSLPGTESRGRQLSMGFDGSCDSDSSDKDGQPEDSDLSNGGERAHGS